MLEVARIAASIAISLRMTGFAWDGSLVHIFDSTHWNPFAACIKKTSQIVSILGGPNVGLP